MKRKHILAALGWVSGAAVAGLFASWGVTREFWILPWSPLVIGVVLVCAISYLVIEQWPPRTTPARKDAPSSASTPRRSTSTFTTFGHSNTVRDAIATVDRVARATAEFEAANDDSDFPSEKTGEQIFGISYHADKLTDGTWEIYRNGETGPIAKMSAIPGGWSVIHVRAGYVGKYRTELQVFEALDQQPFR